MFLGKVLKCIGTPNPYPESRNPENKTIEPTADTAEETDVEEIDLVTLIKTLRKKCVSISENIYKLRDRGSVVKSVKGLMYAEEAFLRFEEGDMRLGMILSEILEAKENPSK